MENKDIIEDIYKLSVKLYYDVADDSMLRRGIAGPTGLIGINDSQHNKTSDINSEILEGAIRTLQEVLNKLKK